MSLYTGMDEEPLEIEDLVNEDVFLVRKIISEMHQQHPKLFENVVG